MTEMLRSKIKLWITLLVIGAFALTLGVWLQIQANKDQPGRQILGGTVFHQPQALKPFQLTKTDGKAFTNKNLKGHWTLMFFGFTHCPMVCPTTLAELNKAYKIIESVDKKALPRIAFISIDPKRDTETTIRTYLKSFNTNFVGLRAQPKQLEVLTKQLGILYMKASKSGEKDYDIEHSGAILVINPAGKWSAVLTSPHDGATIAEDVLRIQKQYIKL